MSNFSGVSLNNEQLPLRMNSFRFERFCLDAIVGLFGESGFGPVSQIVTAGIEGALFAGCGVGAMILARRDMSDAI